MQLEDNNEEKSILIIRVNIILEHVLFLWRRGFIFTAMFFKNAKWVKSVNPSSELPVKVSSQTWKL